MSFEEATKQQVRAFLAERLLFDFEPGVDADDVDLFDSGAIDSLGFVNLIGFLQSTYGLSLQPEELDPERFKTVNAIVGLISARRA